MTMLTVTPNLSIQISKLIPKGQLTLATIDPKDKQSPVICKTFTMPQQVAQASAWALQANTTGRNCYFHTNIGNTINRRLSKNDVSSVRLVWGDIDLNINQYGSYSKAKFHLNLLIPKLSEYASLIIDSGNGLQVLYRIAPTVNITEQIAKEEYEIINRAIAKRWDADSTQDCSRILRLPGTLNYPSQAKIEKGYPCEPTFAKIIYSSAKEFTLESIQEALEISNQQIEQARTEYHSKSKGTKWVEREAAGAARAERMRPTTTGRWMCGAGNVMATSRQVGRLAGSGCATVKWWRPSRCEPNPIA